MALNWNWNDKVGEAVTLSPINGNEWTLSLYQGNAYLIFLSEWEENDTRKYSMWSFWADKAHAKRCLGLGKNGDGNYENIYAGKGYPKITKFRFNKDKTRCFMEMTGLILRAFDDITIEVYSEKGEDE